MHGKNFANFGNSVIVVKLFCWYILNSIGINSALLELQNFSIGMQSRVIFTKLFPRVIFPTYSRQFDSYTEHHNLKSQSKCTDNHSNLIKFIYSK